MCTTCGCGEGQVTIDGKAAHPAPAHEHVHAGGTTHILDHAHPHAEEAAHGHDHAGAGYAYVREDAHGHDNRYAPVHAHAPGLGARRMVQIEQDILSRNNAYAAENRQRLAERGIFALNLVSGPGSGKTTLLCKTIAMLGGQSVAVIEGDQQTSQDAERIRATGAPAVQINTGKGCHLDAHMVGHAMEQLRLPEDSLLMIENVGNLVCPAAFDLGEAHKVVILSVTEGEDKPIKYPDMFRAASLLLLNKVDLLPYLEFDVDAAIGYARRVNPRIRVIRVSATRGEGMSEWIDFLRAGLAGAQAARRQAGEPAGARIAQPAAAPQPALR
jgi:hydrogenase nickel incorporation protein HypB